MSGLGSGGGSGGGCGGDDDRRLLLVHAHPDDEAIGTGATMAKYAAEGARVTLVTCTLGELGEVIPEELAYLAAGQENRLGQYRVGELDAACQALGVTDHRFLGGPGRWRDSGMMGLPANGDPGCFWQADVDEAAAELVAVVREVRPQVIVTYDANGFYGHPDHIQAHRVAWRAVQLAGDPAFELAAGSAFELAAGPAGHQGGARAAPWRVAKFYATAAPGAESVTTEIDGTRYLAAKTAAMRAHATQITVDSPCYALSNQVVERIAEHECYTLLAGQRGPAAGPAGHEDDLFSGL
jgi:N-acetyl-1-D-myo-inositol-2-amino-2-deoxy-alpha-D-glucopyranoside deacetylase